MGLELARGISRERPQFKATKMGESSGQRFYLIQDTPSAAAATVRHAIEIAVGVCHHSAVVIAAVIAAPKVIKNGLNPVVVLLSQPKDRAAAGRAVRSRGTEKLAPDVDQRSIRQCAAPARAKVVQHGQLPAGDRFRDLEGRTLVSCATVRGHAENDRLRLPPDLPGAEGGAGRQRIGAVTTPTSEAV